MALREGCVWLDRDRLALFPMPMFLILRKNLAQTELVFWLLVVIVAHHPEEHNELNESYEFQNSTPTPCKAQLIYPVRDVGNSMYL